MSEPSDCCQHGGHEKKRSRFFTPLVLTLIGVSVLYVISSAFPFLKEFRHTFLHYLHKMWFPIVLGLFLGGVIDYYIPGEYISKHLAEKKKRTVFYAVGLGFLMSACSHGILAVSMALHKKGASGPAVVAFLLASPWTSLPITLLLFGFFGWKALLIILASLFVAVTTGFGLQFLDGLGWIEQNKNIAKVEEGFSVRKDLAKRIREYPWSQGQIQKDISGILAGAYSLVKMILWWILIGIVLASLASAFVPERIFSHYFGPTVLGLLVTVALATVLEVCSEGTSPLAFEIYRQTGAFGNAFVFLMGGVVTDFTEIGLVWMNLGKKTAIAMLLFSLPQVLAFGWVFNRLFLN